MSFAGDIMAIAWIVAAALIVSLLVGLALGASMKRLDKPYTRNREDGSWSTRQP